MYLIPGGRTATGMSVPSQLQRPGIGSGDVSARVVTRTFDFETIADATFLSSVAAETPRPNLLIQCARVDIDALIARVSNWCVSPFRSCAVPGLLSLPVEPIGALMVHDVSALTVPQQIDLYDWMTGRLAQTQVISVTSVPLPPRVESGQFLQGLFHRLNAIQANATRRTCGERPKGIRAVSD